MCWEMSGAVLRRWYPTPRLCTDSPPTFLSLLPRPPFVRCRTRHESKRTSLPRAPPSARFAHRPPPPAARCVQVAERHLCLEGRAGPSRAAEGIAGPLRGFVPLHTFVSASHVLLECGFFFLSVLCKIFMSEPGDCTTYSVFIRKSFRSGSYSASACFGRHSEFLRCSASCLGRMRVWTAWKDPMSCTFAVFLWAFPLPLARISINAFEELICDI